MSHITYIPFPHKSDPRFVITWLSNHPTSPLHTMLLLSTFGLLPGLGANENWQRQWRRGIPPARRVFLKKTIRIRERPAASHVNLQSSRSRNELHVRKHKESEPDESAGFLQSAFSLEKARSVGAVGRNTYKFTVTLKVRRLLIYWRKHMECQRVVATRFFLEKRCGI